jgi:general secretion pathway protein G
MYYLFMIGIKSELKDQEFKAKRGFTLIELLVVIAIIGVLAAFLMSNFIGIRQRGRDAQRKSDLRQIQAALELYRSDNSGYPASLWDTSCPQSESFEATVNESTVVYMKKLPCDPLSSNTPYSYTYNSADQTYSITACLENLNDPDKDTTNVCSSGVSFTVESP